MSTPKLTTNEIWDDELGGLTIVVNELPLVYGEGATRSEAISNLIDAAIELCDVVKEKPEFCGSMSKKELVLIHILIEANSDREVIYELIYQK